MSEISRRAYADMYGPTTGDRIRLGDTELWIEVEEDKTDLNKCANLTPPKKNKINPNNRSINDVEKSCGKIKNTIMSNGKNKYIKKSLKETNLLLCLMIFLDKNIIVPILAISEG